MMKKHVDKFIDYFSGSEPLFLLESQSKNHKASRYSYIAARPVATIKARGRQVEVIEGDECSQFEANPWEALSAFRKKQDDYLFGYLSYDLKNHTEQLSSNNQDKIEAPDLLFIVPSVLLKIDHQKNRIEGLKGDIPEIESRTGERFEVAISGICSSVDREEYISRVEQVKNDIYEGKYYELNFTHQLKAHFTGRPYALYRKMRQTGPVPFGAYAEFGDIAVSCLSPERFLCKKGRKLFSQPIKGTIKRADINKEDNALKNKLKKSVKDRAENMMIVDLVRNDLSRIAQKGSVKVEELFEIQSFPTVHQMVSTVAADTEETNPVEIIKACFPMGSMTGAPKVSVMKRIEELESYRRGIYSGAIGYIMPSGDFDFNVVIRTAVLRQNKLFYSVGGAITADSDPESEWEETWLKAKTLRKVT